MLSLRRPPAAALDRLVADQSRAPLSYPAVGCTADGARPPGYRYDRWDVDLGPDDGDRFDRCVVAIDTWVPQHAAGLTIWPDRPVEPDLTFALVIPLPVGFATAAGRVVYVVREPARAGFAYGTLPAHPEQGEEAFVVVRRDGRVRFEVTALSKPRHPLARLGAPVTRLLQLRTNNRYLAGMQRAAA